MAIEAAYAGLLQVLTWSSFSYLLYGVGLGMFIGAIPGLGGVVGLIILLPFTYEMEPVHAFALLIGLYAVSAFMIAQFEMRRRAEVLEEEAEAFQYEHISSKKAYIKFLVLASAIVFIGVWLAYLGEEIAVRTGIGESFVGALLLAAATSLPEVVSSLAAIKLDAVDLAVSNVFGSNLFNLAILGTYDLFYLPGNLLDNVNQIHIFTGIIGMVMTSVAITGLIYNAARRTRLYITWDGITLIILYVGAMYTIYRS